MISLLGLAEELLCATRIYRAATKNVQAVTAYGHCPTEKMAAHEAGSAGRHTNTSSSQRPNNEGFSNGNPRAGFLRKLKTPSR